MFGLTRNQDIYETMTLIAQGVRAGLPLPEAIRLPIFEKNNRSREEKSLLRLAEQLEKGQEPSEAIKSSGLPKEIANLFDVAVNSRDFALTFEELATIETRKSLAFGKIIRALAYPMMLLCICLAAGLFGFTYVVPQMESLYADMGTALPAMTETILWVAKAPSLLVLVIFFGVIISITHFVFPRFWFLIPVLGRILSRIYMSSLLRQLAVMVHLNVPLPEALRECARTMWNRTYRKECQYAAEDAQKGMPFEEIIVRYYWLFPPWLASSIVMSNTNAQIARTLREAADTSDRQQEFEISFLQSICMPMFIIFFFFLVFISVISFYLPMMKMITEMSAG